MTHCVHGVIGKIEKHLLQVDAVRPHWQWALNTVRFKADASSHGLWLKDVYCILDDLRQVEFLMFALASTLEEFTQMADDADRVLGGLLSFGNYRSQALVLPCIGAQSTCQRLQIDCDGVERLAKLMRKGSRQRAHLGAPVQVDDLRQTTLGFQLRGSSAIPLRQ